ncbi:DUF448 domain-containing protein [uncultured Pseudokineococcus sp.]|uniref:DUF448 domain-containing protein n=1 Tax=uncultured Pseudokineococcus sp. TaxID=1642928 RepID=UPI0026116C2F|nr:DUF448 domain-containing protein [uncultured Pseudokineococcus sp.]
MGCRTTTSADDLLRLAVARPPAEHGETASPGGGPDADPGTGTGTRTGADAAPDAGPRRAGPPVAVAVAVAVVPDPRRRLGGRGAWLHPDPACLALALRRRALPRALRTGAPVDASAVEAHLAVGPPSPSDR